MTVELVPDINIPFLFGKSPADFADVHERARIALKTYEKVVENGGDVIDVRKRDVYEAENTFNAITKAPDTRIAFKTFFTPMGIELAKLLRLYEEDVVENAAQLRIYATNRLIEESNSSNPSIRIKALELLGKITDVGLFTERTENVTTIRHIGDDELNKRLKELLDERVVEVKEEKEESPQ